MADQKITELPIKKSSAMAATDYLLGIDSNEGYQMLIQDLGDYILRNTTLSDLATTSKNAFGAINETTQVASGNTAGRIGMLSNVNLDDLHTDNTCGVYWLNNYSSDVTGTKPVAEGQGLLIVKKQNGTTYGQTYIAVTGTYFAVRSYSSSSWGEWQSASLQTSLDNKLDLYTGTKIESNTDLNTLTTPGTYFCVNTATAATLVNSPLSSVGFRLDVSRNGYNTDNYLVQTIQAVSTSVVVTYKRGMSVKGTWGAWTKQAAMTDVPNIVTQSLGGDFDMNTITQTGVYYFASASNIQNAPTSTYGYLHMIVLGVSGFPAQIVFGGRQASAPDSQKIWVRYKTSTSSDTWTDWYSFGHEGTEYTSLACAYGTLTYKCYKIGRIVSLIATIDVTSDIPKSSDFITGLPYTGQTSNYTPIRAFNDTTKTYIDLDLHRVSTSSCAVLSRTAIASGASICINATYVTE